MPLKVGVHELQSTGLEDDLEKIDCAEGTVRIVAESFCTALQISSDLVCGLQTNVENMEVGMTNTEEGQHCECVHDGYELNMGTEVAGVVSCSWKRVRGR